MQAMKMKKLETRPFIFKMWFEFNKINIKIKNAARV